MIYQMYTMIHFHKWVNVLYIITHVCVDILVLTIMQLKYIKVKFLYTTDTSKLPCIHVVYVILQILNHSKTAVYCDKVYTIIIDSWHNHQHQENITSRIPESFRNSRKSWIHDSRVYYMHGNVSSRFKSSTT